MMLMMMLAAAAARPWLDPAQPPSQRAAALIAKMTPKEKLVLLQGAGGAGIGNTAAIPSLGVPAIHLEDGPNGVADWCTEVTTWPSSMTMAASFDTALMRKYGAACGSEQRGKGMQVGEPCGGEGRGWWLLFAASGSEGGRWRGWLPQGGRGAPGQPRCRLPAACGPPAA